MKKEAYISPKVVIVNLESEDELLTTSNTEMQIIEDAKDWGDDVDDI